MNRLLNQVAYTYLSIVVKTPYTNQLRSYSRPYITRVAYSRLDDVGGTDHTPFDGSRVTFCEDGNGLAIDDKFTVLCFNGALETTVGGVVLEHVYLSEVATSKYNAPIDDDKDCNSYHVLQVNERASWQEDEDKSTIQLRYSLIDAHDFYIAILKGITKNDTANTT